MPTRETPLVNDYYYHIFNRSVAKIPIFKRKKDYFRLLDLLSYYQFKNTPLSFSVLIRKDKDTQRRIFDDLEKNGKKLVEIVCFCLMPNHFHLLAKQVEKKGILTFTGNFQNGYAKYFNILYQRVGPLFQDRFKAVLAENEKQILHLSRYIHLNPYSSFVVKNKKDLIFYPWSSLPEYLGKQKGFCQSEIVLNQFNSTKDYLDFVLDRADYQRRLKEIEHLVWD